MKRVPLALSLCLLSGSCAAPEDPSAGEATQPSHFAQGLILEPGPQLAIQTLLLPIEVYRGSRGDLSDLSVFDAQGRAAPFALRALETAAGQRTEELAAPLFPLYEPATPADGKALALHVERSPDGSVLAVRMSDEKPPAGAAPVVAYILDSAKAQRPISGLRLELAPRSESYTATFKVEASDDLSAWQVVAGAAAVGRLSFAGQTVERQRIEIAPTRAPFLRLRGASPFPVRILNASLLMQSATIERERATARVAVRAVPTKDGVYEADLGGVLSLVDVAPRLPDNALLRATLSLRETKDGSYRRVFEGALYRLRHAGLALASEPIELGGQRARYLRFELDPRSAAPGLDKLELEVEYAPDQLLFVARGAEGPYTLAYGSYRTVPPRLAAAQLLEPIPQAAREALPADSAKVTSKRSLGGAAAITPPAAPRSYRKPALWAVLIGASGTLLTLALRILRKLR